MDMLRKFVFLLACLLLPFGRAEAAVTVTFYSHDMGTTFPHGIITLTGTPDRGGPAIDTNFGFTAKTVSPAMLMGSVAGEIETLKPSYVKGCDKQFSVTISDAKYDQVMALIEKWRQIPQKSYNLNTRNCLHFVGSVAELMGLKVVYDKKLVKRPKSFLLSIIALNPHLRPAG
jgi:hypothetical protein